MTRIAAAVFVVIALVNYLPAFWGEVPFPRDLVMQHSAWDGQPRSSARQQVAQLIDIVAMFYPFRALAARGAEERSLPLWNPYIMSGAPFQANAQSAVFGPLNTLSYLFPLKTAWTISLILRVFLAGLFMALFVQSIGGSPTGSIVAGILFALCGFTIQWQGMSNGESSIWLPLICYSVHRMFVKPNGRAIAFASIAFALPVLSGHPETAAHITFLASAMALMLWLRGRDNRFLLSFALAGVLALGMASVQVIPTIEWLGLLGPQLDNPQPVLDRHQGQGFFSRDIRSDPNSAGIAVPEGSAYVGMLGLLAASLAPFHRSRRYTIFFAVIVVGAVAVAFGFQPLRWIVIHLPVIKAMKNARMILLADFGIAALAGLGISVLEEKLERRSQARTLLILAGLVASLGIFELHRATLTPVELIRSPLASFVFLLAGFVLLAVRLQGRLQGKVFPIAVCALCAFEMLTFSYGYLGFTPAPEVFPGAPVLNFLHERSDLAEFRVAKDHFPIPHDAGMIYGFEAADGYDLTTERTRTFTKDLAEDRPDGVMFLAESILGTPDRRFDMLNVKYLLASTPGAQRDLLRQSDRFRPVYEEGSVAVFENKSVLPRAYSVPVAGIEVIARPDDQLQRVKDLSFDPQKSVVFVERPSGLSVKSAGEPADVKIVARDINGSSLHVETLESVVVVVSQMYYPGWRATVNGIETPVYPVDYALTGLIVPSGSSDVRLFFSPFSFRLGLGISSLSLLLVLGVGLGSRRNSVSDG